jgi:hypothetical protein
MLGVKQRVHIHGVRLGSSEATPAEDFPDESAIDHERRHHRAHRDHLEFHIAAHTLFVVGSSTAFREHGTALRGLLDEAPSYLHRGMTKGEEFTLLTLLNV